MTTRNKATKRPKGLEELLGVLKSHPQLVHALVFDPTRVKSLLRSDTARRLVAGLDTRAFLRRVAGSEDGGPIAVCKKRTAHLCPKGTRCPGGTRHIKHCAGTTTLNKV